MQWREFAILAARFKLVVSPLNRGVIGCITHVPQRPNFLTLLA